jgi:hypothetical protein
VVPPALWVFTQQDKPGSPRNQIRFAGYTRQVITKDMFYFIRKPTRGVWDIVEETTVGV